MSLTALETSHAIPLAGFGHSDPPSDPASTNRFPQGFDRPREDDEPEEFAEPDEPVPDDPLEDWEEDAFDDDEAEPAPGDFWLDPNDSDSEDV